MTRNELDVSLRAFCSRRPFRHFLIEFTSGVQVHVKHPEVVRQHGSLYVLPSPDHGFCFFSASSVVRLLDVPKT